ncbi:MAG: aldo/keto reductase [Candidatus Methanoperedens sp.]|nr:aldo/keto reductase [Candidatus Methanoperedens sp.]CAG0970073.1 Aldo-keto reductase YhdN [Methanosarcinales archaeon]
MKVSKIALGTAQFGMDYGINNIRGKIPEKEVFEILNEALKSRIDTLDTAYAYGESETMIGEFNKKYKNKFKIVSKSPKCNTFDLNDFFDSSIKRLGVEVIYGYMVHSFQHYMDYPETWNILEKLRSKGKIEKIGFSIYYPHELNYILENKINIDIIQVPYSIFDRRFEPYFSKLKNIGVEIHVRSVFLQGLVFKNPNELDVYFAKIKKKLDYLNLLSMKLNIPIEALCLNFAVINTFVDKVVVGIDNIRNLNEIVDSTNYIKHVKYSLSELSNFREDDEKMILPLNWPIK